MTTSKKPKPSELHATVYCGIPAGLDAFKTADKVLKELGALEKGD